VLAERRYRVDLLGELPELRVEVLLQQLHVLQLVDGPSIVPVGH